GALAFFTVFDIPPILIMIIFILGLFMGQQPATTEVFSQIEQLIGAASSEVLQSIVSHYFVEGHNTMQSLLAIGILLFDLSSFFIIIQHALNRIWNVRPKAKKEVIKIVENRVLSFGIIILMGLILLLSLATQTIFLAIRDDLNAFSPLLSPVVLSI